MKPRRIVSANDHSKSILEAQRPQYGDMVALLIQTSHGTKYRFWVAVYWLLQNRRQRSPGVLDICIDTTCDQGLIANVAAVEIEATLDLHPGLRFNLLRQQFPQHNLLSEVLCANHRMIRMR